MTLGDIIKEYRKNQHLSMDAFSEKSGISKAYISLLEKNKHPKTGKAIAPSIQCIKQAADGMNMDFNTLFSMIDGDVSLKEDNTNDKSQFTSRDERDITSDLNSIMEKLKSGEDGPASFEGEAIPEADQELFAGQLELMLRRLKSINKEKYNPHKKK